MTRRAEDYQVREALGALAWITASLWLLLATVVAHVIRHW